MEGGFIYTTKICKYCKHFFFLPASQSLNMNLPTAGLEEWPFCLLHQFPMGIAAKGSITALRSGHLLYRQRTSSFPCTQILYLLIERRLLARFSSQEVKSLFFPLSFFHMCTYLSLFECTHTKCMRVFALDCWHVEGGGGQLSLYWALTTNKHSVRCFTYAN